MLGFVKSQFPVRYCMPIWRSLIILNVSCRSTGVHLILNLLVPDSGWRCCLTRHFTCCNEISRYVNSTASAPRSTTHARLHLVVWVAVWLLYAAVALVVQWRTAVTTSDPVLLKNVRQFFLRQASRTILRFRGYECGIEKEDVRTQCQTRLLSK